MKEQNPPGVAEDSYSRVDYRRFVAWPARIQRERRLLESFLESLPEPSLLDLGCGTGEHSGFFADLGCRVIGIDSSRSMLDKAAHELSEATVSWIEGDICKLPEMVEGRFGGAISLGNTLPHLLDETALKSFVSGLAKVLLPGGRILIQILNYERIIGQRIRHLPLNFRDEDDHETVFLRLMKCLPGDRILFCPSTLRFKAGEEDPVQVVRSKTVELMGWQRRHLFPALRDQGFQIRDVWGDMQFGAFLAEESSDLVVLAEAG